MSTYLVVIVKYYGTYNAYIPDVPGCVATSSDIYEVRQFITKAFEWHVEAILNAQLPMPEPKTMAHEYDCELEPEDDFVEFGLLYVKGE